MSPTRMTPVPPGREHDREARSIFGFMCFRTARAALGRRDEEGPGYPSRVSILRPAHDQSGSKAMGYQQRRPAAGSEGLGQIGCPVGILGGDDVGLGDGAGVNQYAEYGQVRCRFGAYRSLNKGDTACLGLLDK